MRYHTLTTDLIQQAGQQARFLGHSYVGSAHLLLALIQQPGMAGQLLRGMGMDHPLTWQMTAVLYGSGTPDLPLPQGLTRAARRILRQAAS